MITMPDIVREGHPALRKRAKKLTFPLTQEQQQLASDMLEYLKNSQDEQLAEQYGLRAGVGLAAPQLGHSIQMIALFLQTGEEEDEPLLEDVWVNPRIIRESMQKVCLRDGEGCLSVDREVGGVVIRPERITVQYFTLDGKKQLRKLSDFEAIVVQHEIDHLNGVMFFDHINEKDPFHIPDEVTVLG